MNGPLNGYFDNCKSIPNIEPDMVYHACGHVPSHVHFVCNFLLGINKFVCCNFCNFCDDFITFAGIRWLSTMEFSVSTETTGQPVYSGHRLDHVMVWLGPGIGSGLSARWICQCFLAWFGLECQGVLAASVFSLYKHRHWVQIFLVVTWYRRVYNQLEQNRIFLEKCRFFLPIFLGEFRV